MRQQHAVSKTYSMRNLTVCIYKIAHFNHQNEQNERFGDLNNALIKQFWHVKQIAIHKF